MNRLSVILLSVVLISHGLCFSSFASELIISDIRANLSLPSSTGSVWLKIYNPTTDGDTLLSANVEGCGVTELHEMTMKDGKMMMRQLKDGIAIPAGQTITLKRGGLHIMCIDKANPLDLGKKVVIELEFNNKYQYSQRQNPLP